MDIGSELRSPHARGVAATGGWTITMIGWLPVLAVGLVLLALLVGAIDLLPPPASEPVLSAPFRWHK